MNVATQLHGKAMRHLAEARHAMEKLTTCTSDRAAGISLGSDFNHLEEACREFARCQMGLGVGRGPENPQR